MSIRIQDNYQAGAAADVRRADEISRPPASGKGTSTSSTANASDQVSLSSFSGKIGEALSTQQSQQAERVRQLAAAYSSGNYQVNASNVSKALVSHSIGRASSEQSD
jgi:anti-sigma28 factor (negative regulator of flagellin synthesis)